MQLTGTERPLNLSRHPVPNAALLLACTAPAALLEAASWEGRASCLTAVKPVALSFQRVLTVSLGKTLALAFQIKAHLL